MEVLVPDFGGDDGALATVLAERPHVLNHNLETVPSLYERVRPQADYGRSLQLLRRAAGPRARAGGAHDAGRPLVKSGLMVGLGESGAEVGAVLVDCVAAGVEGGHRRPVPAAARRVRAGRAVRAAARVRRLGARGAALGLRVIAAPFVRSSYRAAEVFRSAGVARERPARRARADDLPLPTPAAVIFDLDYTLRRPGDQFAAAGYQRTGRCPLRPSP